MMARLPSFEQLGQTPSPQPSGAVSGYTPGRKSPQGEAPIYSGNAGNQALVQLGGTLAHEGEAIGQFLKIEQEKTDTIKVEDAWNQYKTHAIELTHGERGLLKTQGADAVNGNLLATSTASLADQRSKILESLGNDEQKARFKQRADITDLQTKQSLYSHLAVEQKQYAKTTFEGSGALARSEVAADPMSESAFLGAKDTLMRQTDNYLNLNGIQDNGTREDLRAKMTDSLLATRLEAMLSMNQPLAAEKLFKEMRGEIKNPEIRMTYMNRTRAAAIPANASIRAGAVFDEVVTEDNDRRAKLPQISRATPEGGPRSADALVDAVIKQESGGRQSAVSPKGAIGIMQVMPATAKQVSQQLGIPFSEERLRTDPAYNKQLGTTYLNTQLDRFGGNQTLALAAYNAGPEVVQDWIAGTNLSGKNGGKLKIGDPNTGEITEAAFAARIPFAETRNYVASINAASPAARFQTVSMADAPLVTDTSGLPNSRDVSALMPVMMTRVEASADELYGKDKTNPDRMAFVKQMGTEIHARVTDTVQQFNAVQRQVQGQFIDMIVGLRTGGATPDGRATGATQRTGMMTVASIQQDPQLRMQWDRLDPAVKPQLLNLMEKGSNDRDKGDPVLYRQLYDRINLPEGDPQKILFPREVLDPRLSIPQIEHLNSTLKSWTTPGGRSFNQLRTTMDAYVGRQMKNNMMFTAQPDRADAAAMQWTMDAGKKVDEYEKAGKDPRTLFLMDSKDSIVTPQYLQTYVNSTPAQGLASGAAGVAAGAQRPLAEQAPPQPKSQAEYDALPAGSTYLSLKGQPMQKPGQATADASTTPLGAPAATNYGARADGTQKGPGFFGALPARGGQVSTEISIGVNLDGKEVEIPSLVPGLTQSEIKLLLDGGKPTDAIVDKAVAHAKQRIAEGKSPFAAVGEQVKPPDSGSLKQNPEPTIEEFTVLARPATVGANIAALRAARVRAAEIRKLGAQGPQYDITGPLVSLARGAGEAIDNIGAPGRALGRAIPTELEAIYSGFDAIKKARKVSAADEDILEQTIQYGLLKPEDEKLAKGLLAKIKAKQ